MMQPTTSLELVNLPPLMAVSSGREDLIIALIDGPVNTNHPDLARGNIHEIQGSVRGACVRAGSTACRHGTFVAGILSATRDSPAPAICPDCTLLVRPIFEEIEGAQISNATPQWLAKAALECIDAGARILNVSSASGLSATRIDRELEGSLNYAAQQGAIVVAAAGNQGTVGSSALIRHPWVIPVVGYGLHGQPMGHSNLGNCIGRRGLGAPSEDITSLGAEGKPVTLEGTSFAAPFVTGAIALLWSEFPAATAVEIKNAVTKDRGRRRAMITPPLLDAWRAYQMLAEVQGLRT